MPRAKNRRRRAGSSGFSLVEVMVAMLISAVMVTAVMGVAVTSKQGSVKSSHRQMFDQSMAQMSAELKTYVTACGCSKGGACAGGCYMGGATPIQGPNLLRAGGVASWYLNGSPAPGGGTITDSKGDVWALACGAHTLTGLVPSMEAAPYSGNVSYTVTWPAGSCAGTPGTSDVPTIQFAANWTEP